MLISLQRPSLVKSSQTSVTFPAVPSHPVLAQTAEVVSATAQTVLNAPQEHASSNTTNSPSAPLEVVNEAMEEPGSTASAPPEEEGSENSLPVHNYENLKMDGSNTTANAVSTIPTSVYPQLQATASSQQYEPVNAGATASSHSVPSVYPQMYTPVNPSTITASSAAASMALAQQTLSTPVQEAVPEATEEEYVILEDEESLVDVLQKETYKMTNKISYQYKHWYSWSGTYISEVSMHPLPIAQLHNETVAKIYDLMTTTDLGKLKAEDRTAYDRLSQIVRSYEFSSIPSKTVKKISDFVRNTDLQKLRTDHEDIYQGLLNIVTEGAYFSTDAIGANTMFMAYAKIDPIRASSFNLSKADSALPKRRNARKGYIEQRIKHANIPYDSDTFEVDQEAFQTFKQNLLDYSLDPNDPKLADILSKTLGYYLLSGIALPPGVVLGFIINATDPSLPGNLTTEIRKLIEETISILSPMQKRRVCTNIVNEALPLIMKRINVDHNLRILVATLEMVAIPEKGSSDYLQLISLIEILRTRPDFTNLGQEVTNATNALEALLKTSSNKENEDDHKEN